ncbi:hypothetical protein Y1Q_0005039 [Alligator mississippiensis]|uniref:Uncharacterized protein n=1 Tax=Alligator mississippiensis TaxID=8496 RepID=A0A151N066_ALLMI|nr:hypothetical protein Y1Q_0005039 [Alligator mississippiensis]
MWLAGAEKDVVCAGVQASLCQFGEEEMGAICAWRYGVSWWNRLCEFGGEEMGAMCAWSYAVRLSNRLQWTEVLVSCCVVVVGVERQRSGRCGVEVEHLMS